jgi:hypothetical protein
MVITGSNFFPESKVIFLEKGPGKRLVHTASHTQGEILRDILAEECDCFSLLFVLYCI